MEKGLTQKEVQERITAGKINTLESRITRSYKDIFFSNIFTFFNLINVILFILILMVKSYRNGLFFFTILANTVVGIVQEIRSKQTLDKLAIVTVNKIDVIRDGIESQVRVDEIVLDDCVILKEGMQIPSDALVLDGKIEANESLLTGESVPQLKEVGSSVLSGSFVTSGEAVCKVIHVGKDNYAQKIVSEAKKYKTHQSELKKSINIILKVISVLIVPVGLLLFYNQYYRLESTLQVAIVRTVAALVGMIPEGLVFLTSVALAISVIRLANQKTLVQELYCVETLARVDVLCLDKTGTITEGKMKVIESEKFEEFDFDKVLGNYVRIFSKGNATATALAEAFEQRNDLEVINKEDFSSDRKYSAITVKNEGTYYLGAAQILFPQNKKVLDKAKEAAEEGYRVIILGVNRKNDSYLNCIPLGLIKIQDSIRSNAKDTIRYFYEQDVECKVISGDDPVTVASIAKQVGIKKAEFWVDASKLNEDELRQAIVEKNIFGRVTPGQKKIMVDALQKAGHTVAMTGDGVNDVQALKKADVSIAMASGSDATKNVSNIVLLDSDFSHLPFVVKEGRRVINNIRSASSMFLVKTGFSVMLAILTIILADTYPFQPIQLTVISMFAVGIPTFLLQFEPSFGRIDKKFLRVAFRNALPAAFIIAMAILTGIIFSTIFKIPEIMISSFNAIQTGILYTSTLYFVYTPLTKYRVSIIITMQVLLGVAFIVAQKFIGITALNESLVIFVICYTVLSYFLMKILRELFDKAENALKK
ncbi:HAD-IC family P-type ATPase [Anaerorhabdus sp.]|uniref:HAD-IC family P-type ATPase n=1 Tax=Anaerorhabdus sp. TaxID=1872524 RepID=UPI002FC882BB